ncbi:hypothetical protein LguiA_029062 [Lonicera macranthoides]
MCDINFREISRAEFRILTIGTDLYWRNLDCVPDKLGFGTRFGVCCVDDVIFCSGWVDGTEVIVAFEVGPEKFRVIPPPNGASTNSRRIHIIQVGGLLSLVNVDYASAGEVDVDELTTGDHVNEARNIEDVEGSDVMTIWILEDYHKQQWKKEIISFASSWSFHSRLITTPMGSIHTKTKSLRTVPKVTAFPNEYQQRIAEEYDEDEIRNRSTFIDFTKHVECLFRLK